MSNLSQLLQDPTRTSVTAELATFVDETVAAQSGLTGMALKGAVAAAKKMDSAIVVKGMNRLLPDITGELEPYWQDFVASGQADFGAFLEPRAGEVTDTIMKVADRHAQTINVPALAKAYSSLRGKASNIIEPQIPALARIVQKHVPA